MQKSGILRAGCGYHPPCDGGCVGGRHIPSLCMGAAWGVCSLPSPKSNVNKLPKKYYKTPEKNIKTPPGVFFQVVLLK